MRPCARSPQTPGRRSAACESAPGEVHVDHRPLVLGADAVAEHEARPLDLAIAIRATRDGLVVEANGDEAGVLRRYQLLGRRPAILVCVAPDEQPLECGVSRGDL